MWVWKEQIRFIYRNICAKPLQDTAMIITNWDLKIIKLQYLPMADIRRSGWEQNEDFRLAREEHF